MSRFQPPSSTRNAHLPARRYSRSWILTVLLPMLVVATVLVVLIQTAFPTSRQRLPRSNVQLWKGSNKNARMIVFGPQRDDEDGGRSSSADAAPMIRFQWYSVQEQTLFVQQHGDKCYPNLSGSVQEENNHLWERYRSSDSAFLRHELWKFCFWTLALQDVTTATKNSRIIYWDRDQMVPFIPWQDLTLTQHKSMGLLIQTTASGVQWLHPSWMYLTNNAKHKFWPRLMLNLWMETPQQLIGTNPSYPYQVLAQQYALKESKSSWHVYETTCQGLRSHYVHDDLQVSQVLLPSLHHPTHQKNSNQKRQTYSHAHSMSTIMSSSNQDYIFPSYQQQCSFMGIYCCQVWPWATNQQQQDKAFNEQPPKQPIMALRHYFAQVDQTESSTMLREKEPLTSQEPSSDKNPYISTISVVPTAEERQALHVDGGASVTTTSISISETPNMFHILFQNDCLPTSAACQSCLKKYTFGPDICDPSCAQDCPCYCQAICNIRPPPKRVSSVWYVSPPTKIQPHQRLQDASFSEPRWIPRIIHQTWFEPITKEKYPNMSRLQQSWKQSGWKHVFYDDEKALNFLQTHFPVEVVEAYQAIIPGAFKADLFRYCVLLIHGGVYADMDVLLETNLEHAIPPDVGFMTPMDEPGSQVDHASCLWNGFMAVAPGHVFIAKTIELVVNNIRNRFTSVDYDNLLCPHPVLSASHLWDILFTTGPCILGAAINQVLERHPQTSFQVGEIDIWNSTHDQPQKSKPNRQVRPQDPRWAIPGRSIILRQDKNDMGAHRFNLEESNLLVCSTDLPDYDDRPKTIKHYSESGKQTYLYGTTQLYQDDHIANEEIRVVIGSRPETTPLAASAK